MLIFIGISQSNIKCNFFSWTIQIIFHYFTFLSSIFNATLSLEGSYYAVVLFGKGWHIKVPFIIWKLHVFPHALMFIFSLFFFKWKQNTCNAQLYFVHPNKRTAFFFIFKEWQILSMDDLNENESIMKFRQYGFVSDKYIN